MDRTLSLQAQQKAQMPISWSRSKVHIGLTQKVGMLFISIPELGAASGNDNSRNSNSINFERLEWLFKPALLATMMRNLFASHHQNSILLVATQILNLLPRFHESTYSNQLVMFVNKLLWIRAIHIKASLNILEVEFFILLCSVLNIYWNNTNIHKLRKTNSLLKIIFCRK